MSKKQQISLLLLDLISVLFESSKKVCKENKFFFFRFAQISVLLFINIIYFYVMILVIIIFITQALKAAARLLLFS